MSRFRISRHSMSTEMNRHAARERPFPSPQPMLLICDRRSRPTKIDIQCTDAFGHQKQQNIQLNWEPPEGDDGLFGGLPPMVLAGGGLVALIVLGLVVAGLRGAKKPEIFPGVNPHVDDGGRSFPHPQQQLTRISRCIRVGGRGSRGPQCHASHAGRIGWSTGTSRPIQRCRSHLRPSTQLPSIREFKTPQQRSTFSHNRWRSDDEAARCPNEAQHRCLSCRLMCSVHAQSLVGSVNALEDFGLELGIVNDGSCDVNDDMLAEFQRGAWTSLCYRVNGALEQLTYVELHVQLVADSGAVYQLTESELLLQEDTYQRASTKRLFDVYVPSDVDLVENYRVVLEYTLQVPRWPILAGNSELRCSLKRRVHLSTVWKLRPVRRCFPKVRRPP